MKFNSIEISNLDRMKFITKIWFLKTFGNDKDSDEAGMTVKAQAQYDWYMIHHDEQVLLEMIWDQKADDELKQARAEFETADYQIGYM